MERYDRRLASLPAHALFPLAKRLCALDEGAGWWRGRFPRPPAWLDAARAAAIASSGEASARLARGASATPGAAAPAAAVARDAAALLADLPGRLAGEPFSEALVLSFHARLVASQPDSRDGAGRYKGATRSSPFLRWGLEPDALRSPGSHLVPREMERLVEWTAKSLSPGSPYPALLVVAAFLMEFHALRPFADGNGRTARALAAFLLLRHHHPGILHVSLDALLAERYYELLLALRKSQATRNLPRPDLLPWLHAFLSLLEEHGRRLRALGEGTAREEELTATQARVLGTARKGGTLTTGSVAAALGVSRETAKLSLGRLAAAGMLVRLGAGRGCRYRLCATPGGR